MWTPGHILIPSKGWHYSPPPSCVILRLADQCHEGSILWTPLASLFGTSNGTSNPYQLEVEQESSRQEERPRAETKIRLLEVQSGSPSPQIMMWRCPQIIRQRSWERWVMKPKKGKAGSINAILFDFASARSGALRSGVFLTVCEQTNLAGRRRNVLTFILGENRWKLGWSSPNVWPCRYPQSYGSKTRNYCASKASRTINTRHHAEMDAMQRWHHHHRSRYFKRNTQIHIKCPSRKAIVAIYFWSLEKKNCMVSSCWGLENKSFMVSSCRAAGVVFWWEDNFMRSRRSLDRHLARRERSWPEVVQSR